MTYFKQFKVYKFVVFTYINRNNNTLQWKKIIEKYPKAWSELCKFHRDTNEDVAWIDHPDVWVHEGMGINTWELRHLYDFFDDNNLNIYIKPEYYYTGINWNWQILWHKPTKPENKTEYLYQCGGTGMYGDNNEYPTRQEAEQASFLKAFELLEDKLNK